MADIDNDGEMIQGEADERRALMNEAAENKALDDRAAADRKADENKRAADRKADDRKADDQKRADAKAADQRRDDARRADQQKEAPAAVPAEPESRPYEAPQEDRFVDHRAEAELTQARADFNRQEREIESAQSGAPSDRPRPPEAKDAPLKPLDIAQDHKLHGERAAVERREWEAAHRQVTERQEGMNQQIYAAAPETPRSEPMQEVQGEPAIEVSAADQASAQQTMDVHVADQSQEQEQGMTR